MSRSPWLAGFALGSATTVLVTLACQSLFVRSEESSRKRRTLRKSAHATTSGVEHVSFLTELVAQLWRHINVAGSGMMRSIVEPKFAKLLPGPLSTLKFTKVDLGSVPFRFDNIVVHDIKDGTVQFDMDILWDGECDISMKADYTPPLGVKSMKLEGRLSMLLRPLTNEIPCISAVQYAFVNTPSLELDFTGLLQVADLTIIDKTVRKIILETLESVMVLPIRMLHRMDYDTDFSHIYVPPLGIARIKMFSGRGFVIEKRLLAKDDIPDIYLKASVGQQKFQTKTIRDNLDPVWDETFDFVLSNYDQCISIEAWDQDEGPLDPDDFLGRAEVSFGEITLAGKRTEVELLDDKGRSTGAFLTLGGHICLFTEDLRSFRSETLGGDMCGMLTIIVSKASALPIDKETASSFVKVSYGELNFVTGVVQNAVGVDALNPIYDCYFDVPLSADMLKKGSNIVFELMNGSESLGILRIPDAAVVKNKYRRVKGKKESIGKGGAKLDFYVTMKGIEAPTNEDWKSRRALQSTYRLKEGLGMVRLTVLQGHGFQVKRSVLRKDIPDIYAKVTFNRKEWRTSTIKNNVEPLWNESKEFHAMNAGHFVTLNVWDEDSTSKDDFVGSARIRIGKLLLAGGPIEIELEKEGRGTSCFIVLSAKRLSAS